MNRIKQTLLAVACLVPVLGMFTGAANAQATQQMKPVEVTVPYLQAGKIPVETFYKRAEFTQMVMSPDGFKLAARAPFKGRNNLVVIDLTKRTRNIITSFESVDVADIEWVNNERIFMRVADGQDVNGRNNYRGQYAVNFDGSELRDLNTLGAGTGSVNNAGRTANFGIVSRMFDGSPTVIINTRQRTRDSADLYKLNTKTGKIELITFDSPGRVDSWVLDRDLVPRVAVRLEPRVDKARAIEITLWHRASADAKWEKFYSYDSDYAGDQIEPLQFDFDNKTLYVASNVGRDKFAIYKYDLAAKKLGELVFEDALIDLQGGLIFSRAKKKLTGIRYSPDKPRIKWFDEDQVKLQAQIDATFPNTFNAISGSDNEDALRLVFAQSDVDSGEYHLYDGKKKSLETLVRTREWLAPELMSPRQFIKYKARDGREIPAWVTIPKGSSGKNMPLIVHIHGGPQVRGYAGTQWGRPDAQFLASRGYVVLEPEPRASTGYGKSHVIAGYKQWGLSMQDDLTDGALHLVKEGIADKNRMGLFGGSYGGYATLQGMVKEPDLFKAGYAYIAVADLFVLQNVTYSDTAQLGDYLDTDFKRWVGDPVADKAQMTLTSPALNADKIKGKLVVSMGSDDVRVPLVHGERMRDAMDKAGNPIGWKVYTGEGHGYNKDANVFDFYKDIESFFAKNLK